MDQEAKELAVKRALKAGGRSSLAPSHNTPPRLPTYPATLLPHLPAHRDPVAVPRLASRWRLTPPSARGCQVGDGNEEPRLVASEVARPTGLPPARPLISFSLCAILPHLHASAHLHRCWQHSPCRSSRIQCILFERVLIALTRPAFDLSSSPILHHSPNGHPIMAEFRKSIRSSGVTFAIENFLTVSPECKSSS